MKHLASVLCLASFVLSFSAHAAFTRLATETYPGGGGGGPTNGVTAVQATNIAHAVVSTDVAPWALHGQPKPATDLSGITNLVAASSLASTNYTDNATNALDLAHLAALAATNAALRSALADAAASSTNYTDASTLAATNFVKATVTNYLPLAGGTMTGDITMGNNSLKFDSLRSISAGPDDTLSFDANYYGFGGPGPIDRSLLTADGTPVVTSNMLNGVLAPATNVVMAALCATNDLLKIYADRMNAPDWSATTTYAKGDFVWYTDDTTPADTCLYVAAAAGTGLVPPLNPDKWKKMPDANALFSQSNARLAKNFLPYKGGSNAYVEWQGQNVRVYNGGLFARTLDLQAGFSNLKAYEGTSPYTSLPDYLRGATWNTATPVTNRFAKIGDLDAYLPLAGGTMTGDLKLPYNTGIQLNNGFNRIYAWANNMISFESNGSGSNMISDLKPDDTPVLTAKKAETDYPAITNAYPFAQGHVISNTVAQWEGYWTGSNVWWDVTNYLDSANNKIMRLYELQTNGVVREVWNDSDKYAIFFTNTLAYVSETNAYTREWVGTFVTNSLDAKADRAWGKYTSSGEDAPTNMVWHTAPTTVLAGGYEFKKVAIGGGTIGVLVSQGAVPYATGMEGKFVIGDGFGTNYFGYVKSDDYIIACGVDGITTDPTTKMVSLKYDLVFSGEYPIVYYSPTVLPITSQSWIQLNKADGSLTPGAPWPVTFSVGADYIQANISFASATEAMPPEGFFTSSTAVIGGGTFKTNMKADFLDAGLMCTNTDTKVMGVIRPTFDGTTVHWNWSRQ